MRHFTMHDEASGDCHRLTLGGELDRSWIREFDAAVERVCGVEATAIELDLRDVTFIDSSGIRSLIAAGERCRRGEKELRVLPSRQLSRVFEIRGLAEVLPIRQPPV